MSRDHVENLCVNIRAFRVEMDIDGTGNIVSALNRGWRHWDSDRQMVEPTFSVQVNYCKTSFFTELSISRKLALLPNCSFAYTFALFFLFCQKIADLKCAQACFCVVIKHCSIVFFIIPEKPWVEWIIPYFTYILQTGCTKGIETSSFAVGSQWAIFVYCFRHQYWKRSLRE